MLPASGKRSPAGHSMRRRGKPKANPAATAPAGVDGAVQTAMEYMDLALAMEQQGKTDGAIELLQDAIAELQAVTDVLVGNEHDSAVKCMHECEARLEELKTPKTGPVLEFQATKKQLCAEAEAAEADEDFSNAKALYEAAKEALEQMEVEEEVADTKASAMKKLEEQVAEMSRQAGIKNFRTSVPTISVVSNSHDDLLRGRSKTMVTNSQHMSTEQRPRTVSSISHLNSQSVAKLGTHPQEGVAECQSELSRVLGAEFSFSVTQSLNISQAKIDEMSPADKKQFLIHLSAALQAVDKRNCTLENFSLVDSELDVDGAIVNHGLASALSSIPKLLQVSFAGSPISPAGCQVLSRSLVHCNNLSVLDLSNCVIGSEGTLSLCDPLIAHCQTLRQLILARCGIDRDAAKTLASTIAQSQLYQIDLRYNSIGCEAVTALHEFSLRTFAIVKVSNTHNAPDSCTGHPSGNKYLKIENDGVDMLAPKEAEDRRSSFADKLRGTFRRRSRSASPSARSATPSPTPSPVRPGRNRSNSMLDRADTAVSNELVVSFHTQMVQATTKVKVPNILIVGQQGVGKTSVIHAVLGTVNFDPSHKVTEGNATRYSDPKQTAVIWDVHGSVGNGEYDRNCKQLLKRLNTQRAPENHIHIVWYVMDNPKWTKIDENYCTHVFAHCHERQLPVVIILNKADTMSDKDRTMVLKCIATVSRSTDCMKGVFTTVADDTQLREGFTRQLLRENVSKTRMQFVLAQHIQDEMGRLDRITEAMRLTQDVLPDIARDTVVALQKLQLQEKTEEANQVMYNFQSKFEHKKAKGKRYALGQVGKLVHRLSFVWGFRKNEADPSEQELFSLGVEVDSMISLEQTGIVGSNQQMLQQNAFIALGVLLSVLMQRHLLTCLTAAHGGMLATGDSAIREVLNTAREYFDLLSEIEAKIAQTLQAHEAAMSLIVLFTEQLVDNRDGVETEEQQPQEKLTMLQQMISIIAHPDEPDDTRDGFFCSYRLSMKKTPFEVLRALREHFEKHCTVEHLRKDICAKVCGCATYWVSSFFSDDFLDFEEGTSEIAADDQYMDPAFWAERGLHFMDDIALLGGITPMVAEYMKFVDKVDDNGFSDFAAGLRQAIEQAVEAMLGEGGVDAPLEELKFKPLAQFDAFLIAAQLTYHDFGVFRSMSIRDFFTADSPKRKSMISHANLVAYWVVQNIVDEVNTDERLRVMKKLIEVAAALQDAPLNNFHGFMAVMTGLQMSPVQRLKKSWRSLAEEHPTLMQRYHEELAKLADPGNGMYNNVLDRVTGAHPVSPPSVPFLGSFLTAIERTKTRGKGQDTEDVAAAARVQGDVAAAQQKLLKQIPLLQKGVYEWNSFNLVSRFDEFLKTELPATFDISTGKKRNQVEDDLNTKSLICEPRETHNFSSA
eukprot:m.321764 g.321764  ORF g.321764 m.321764 type:complete len:1405 (+) comp19712_c1_seq3:190-4404(+)